MGTRLRSIRTCVTASLMTVWRQLIAWIQMSTPLETPVMITTPCAFKRIGYSKGLGPGTYDIHSPVVPSQKFIKDKIKSFLPCVEIKNLCINPDCGLKTRTWPETIGALKNMVAANDEVRAELGLPTSMSTFKSASLGQ